MCSQKLSIQEVAAYLGYTVSYLYKLNSLNRIPRYKPQGRKKVWYLQDDLDKFLFANRISPQDELNQEASNYVVNRKRNSDRPPIT